MRYLLAAFTVAMVLASPANAHRRHFIQTYEYRTPFKGEWELETYFDVGLHSRTGDRDFRSQIEIENGTTERWANGVYLVHVQDHGDNLKFDALKYETRYRLAEPNRLFLDPALYFEYKMNASSDERDEVEAKIILGKVWRKNHFALNYVAEQELKTGVSTNHGYAVGWAHETSFGSAGVELYGSLSGREHVIAPAIGVALPGRKWAVIELAYPLNGRSQPLTLRTLVEFEW